MLIPGETPAYANLPRCELSKTQRARSMCQRYSTRKSGLNKLASPPFFTCDFTYGMETSAFAPSYMNCKIIKINQ